MRRAAALTGLAIAGLWAALSPSLALEILRPAGEAAPAVAPAPLPRPQADGPAAAAEADHPDAILRRGSLDQLIGQLIIIGFEGRTPDDPGVVHVSRALAEGRLGGVIIMGRNIVDHAQIRTLIGHLRARSAPMVPLIAIDQEGGRVQRLGRRQGFTAVPSAERIGQGPVAAAEARYGAMARELAEIGVNLNFGPVVDLAIDPRNPVIVRHGRSYGRDPKHVHTFSAAFVEAHRREGIATALKHFPGHGSSATDTHTEVADITESWQSDEMTPYLTLSRAGLVDAVMVAHVAHDRLTGGRDRPATLSEEAILGRLRPLLGEQVVVISDDMEMAGVRARHGLAPAAVAAIKAGNDLLIYSNTFRHDPRRLEAIVSAVGEAVAAGEIPRRRIERSLARIARLKARLR